MNLSILDKVVEKILHINMTKRLSVNWFQTEIKRMSFLIGDRKRVLHYDKDFFLSTPLDSVGLSPVTQVLVDFRLSGTE